jgi:DNA-binding NarL/FixJ family response regulator
MGTVVSEGSPEIRVFVLSPVRIYREGLARVLAEEPGLRIVGSAASLGAAEPVLDDARAGVVLLDISTDASLVALRRLGRREGLRVVVLGMLEAEEEILAVAEAGIAGFVAREGSVGELVETIGQAARGEFSCPPRVAAGLLRRVAVLAAGGQGSQAAPRLTMREHEIVRLIEQGLANKEIARRLGIQLATVKNHVHNILEKLGVERRADVAAVSATVRQRI